MKIHNSVSSYNTQNNQSFGYLPLSDITKLGVGSKHKLLPELFTAWGNFNKLTGPDRVYSLTLEGNMLYLRDKSAAKKDLPEKLIGANICETPIISSDDIPAEALRTLQATLQPCSHANHLLNFFATYYK